MKKLYDPVRRGKPPRRSMNVLIALCAVLIAAGGATIFWACRQNARYHDYIAELSESTASARRLGNYSAALNGEAVEVTADDLGSLLMNIVRAGGGRTGRAPQEAPLITVSYGDGATLEIWQVPLKNPAHDWTEGPYLRLRHRPDAHGYRAVLLRAISKNDRFSGRFRSFCRFVREGSPR